MSAPPKKPSGFSLYGDLLDPSKNATITGAPVKYEMKSKPEPEVETVVKKKQDASLKFQPIKRPQVQQQKAKPKNWSSSSSGHKLSSSTVSAPGGQPDTIPQQQAPQVAQPRSTFQDWVGDEDEEEFFFDNRAKHQRGGKKHKNKKGRSQEEKEVDWDAIYDPSKPTILARYQGSTEQEAERREWKEFLYYHASKNKSRVEKRKPKNTMFAPPTSLSFAPPSFDNKPSASDPMDIDDDEDYQPPVATSNQALSTSSRPAVAFSAASAGALDDATGEDAYARRLRLSGLSAGNGNGLLFAPTSQAQAVPVVSSSPALPMAPPPPSDLTSTLAAAHAKLAAAKAKIDAARAQSAAAAATPAPTPPVVAAVPSPPPPPPPPVEDGASISRAPVRYDLADAQIDALVDREAASALSPAQDQPRSKAPGQKGFGARMMAKMGWEKGQGLGAKGEGITTPLVAQAEKRRKRSDKDGGGWAQPRNLGKIVGGKKRKVESTDDDDGQFGVMSYVVKLSGMLTGLDVTYEIEENNLLQEIGEEFGGKYGPIERLFIWRDQNGGNNDVFIRFNSQLGALRAVNGTDGMTFAENPVQSRFFSTEKFEAGDYA